MAYPSGIKFPFQFAVTGGVRQCSGSDKVISNMSALIKSAINERLVRKQVGTIGYSLVLRESVRDNSDAVEQIIFESVVRWIPAISNLKVSVFESEVNTGYAVFARIQFRYLNTGATVDENVRIDS